MQLPDDILAYVAATFTPADREQAVLLLVSARTEDSSPPTARVLRCAVVASEGQLERLRHWVAHLALDWRDVVMAGECVQQDGAPVHARDFSKQLVPPVQDRLAALVQSGALDDWRTVRSVALAWVSALPLNAQEQRWLAQGAAFAAGHIDEAALEETRVEAWDSIDGRECDADDPEISRLRAVLCVLYTDEEMQDAQRYLETLLDFYIGAQGDAALALRALKELT